MIVRRDGDAPRRVPAQRRRHRGLRRLAPRPPARDRHADRAGAPRATRWASWPPSTRTPPRSWTPAARRASSGPWTNASRARRAGRGPGARAHLRRVAGGRVGRGVHRAGAGRRAARRGRRRGRGLPLRPRAHGDVALLERHAAGLRLRRRRGADATAARSAGVRPSVRAALATGDVERPRPASSGVRLSCAGSVARGDARGRDLGFPTANLATAAASAGAGGGDLRRRGANPRRRVVAGGDLGGHAPAVLRRRSPRWSRCTWWGWTPTSTARSSTSRSCRGCATRRSSPTSAALVAQIGVDVAATLERFTTFSPEDSVLLG